MEELVLTVNIDVSDGLVNGARGTVEAIIMTGNQVSLVLVSFDRERVGASTVTIGPSIPVQCRHEEQGS